VAVSDGVTRPADLLVSCTGLAPNVALARGAGLEVRRGVLVDAGLRTSAPGVYAAGDVAERDGQVESLWPAAVAQAEVAAANALGGEETYGPELPAIHLTVGDLEIASLGRAERRAGDEEVAVGEPEGRYRRLLLDDDGRLAGAVLVAQPAEVAAAAREAIASGHDLSGAVEALRAGDWSALAVPRAAVVGR
jgi:nitrite reductase (NADH) large subunit